MSEMVQLVIGRQFYLAVMDAAIEACMNAESIAYDAEINDKMNWNSGVRVGFELGRYNLLIQLACIHAQHNNIFIYQEATP